MAIVAKKSGGGNFNPAPSGSWGAVCCDVVDLGIVESTYSGKTKKQHKIRVVWQIDENMEDGNLFLVSQRYTLSLHEKATLRKDLEAWRGRPFSDDELEGFDVETVIGAPCLLSVVQAASGGNIYANVKGVMKLPRGMQAIRIRDYVRMKDRKPEDASDIPPSGEITDDDVPF